LSRAVVDSLATAFRCAALFKLRPALLGKYWRRSRMSGYTDDAVVLHGVLAADMSFLQKPFTTEMLARRVREVLDAPKGGVG
jgi:hypothetical protein